MKTRNSHGLLQLGREALAYCQCASALISGNKALFVPVDLIGEKNQVILELLIYQPEKHRYCRGHWILTTSTRKVLLKSSCWKALQWWFVNPGSDNPEILLIRTKSMGTDFRFWTDGRFSNPENLLIRKYRQGTNVSGLRNHHCTCITYIYAWMLQLFLTLNYKFTHTIYLQVNCS